MTELERTLTNSLTALEQELTATQEAHTKTLEEHSQAIHRLQQNMCRIETEQQQSAQHLQHLSDIHTSLEPLLSRLSAILNDK
ncbi:MAG: hypothetical protein LUG19_00475 [Desulfovibrio sp.]|uniref:hypothetical protein n=1 Tax=Desulfovibrio sp. TaxID=885 RepID=UPI00258D5B87|nr:hypothetical protein [Desulfovibrio sp.]MCD7982713.1 hypothetical protein [Desulfovibrio sp.]